MSLEISIYRETDWIKEQEMWNYDEEIEEKSPEETTSKANSPKTFNFSQCGKSNWFSNKGHIKEDGKQDLLEELSVVYIRKQRTKIMKIRSSDSFKRERYRHKKLNFSCVVDRRGYKKSKNLIHTVQSNDYSEKKTSKNFQMAEDIKFLLRNLAGKNDKQSSRQQVENLYVTMKDIGSI